MTLELAQNPDNVLALRPNEVVAQATEQANALMQIVNDKELYAVIGQKRYLTAEAWEMIGAFNLVTAVTDTVTPIEASGDVIGYNVKVNLIHGPTGALRGSAEMMCGFEEFPCNGKEGFAKHRAAVSAAQTWATSKAYRMNFSWVAVLAGFEPTPAEEMVAHGSTAQPSAKDGSSYWCEEHQTEFYKRGRMKSYAHKQGDGWHNMPKEMSRQETSRAPDAATQFWGRVKMYVRPDGTERGQADVMYACGYPDSIMDYITQNDLDWDSLLAECRAYWESYPEPPQDGAGAQGELISEEESPTQRQPH